MDKYDLVVTGSGIIGLAAAYAAARRNLKVAVFEQNQRCISASVRNFGFVTVTGQEAGKHYQRARKSREIWADIAPKAGIDVVHQGLLIPAYRQEAAAVCEAFLKTDMGVGCELVSEHVALSLAPAIRPNAIKYLYSPHELRVESRTAIPKLAQWLEEKMGVDFFWQTRVIGFENGVLATSDNEIKVAWHVHCPGHDFSAVPKALVEKSGLEISTLQMLRVNPGTERSCNVSVMSDLSLGRYAGFTDLPEARALQQRLDEDCAAQRAAGVHLIAVRSADGSLVVGDSHVYGEAENPFSDERVDELIMQAFDDVFDLPQRKVVERWSGSYATSGETVFKWQPSNDCVMGIVTGGTGASTGFAFGEELVQAVLDENLE